MGRARRRLVAGNPLARWTIAAGLLYLFAVPALIGTIAFYQDRALRRQIARNERTIAHLCALIIKSDREIRVDTGCPRAIAEG